jgi:AcrR family transcriptional regulator
VATNTLPARERILVAAYELFSRRGIRGVAVDEIITDANTAKATFYAHFPSKSDHVLAFLDRREEAWSNGRVRAGVLARGTTPVERLLAIFDVYDEWFREPDFDACSFVNVMLEMGPDHPLGRASIAHLANLREMVAELAVDAGLRDVEAFSWSWHLLMKGAIICAAEGDRDAARRARAMGERLIADHQEPSRSEAAARPARRSAARTA